MAVFLALTAVSRLSVDTDSSGMLAPDLPFQARAHALNAAFPELKNQLVLVVRAESTDAADMAVAALADTLSQRADLFERVFAPAADPWLAAHGLLYLVRDELDRRLARLGKSANLLAMLRADQSVDGFLRALASATDLAERAGGDPADLAPLYAEAVAVLAAEEQGRDRPFRWNSALAGGDDGPVLRIVTVAPKLDFTALNPAKPALAAAQAAVKMLDPALADAVAVGITGDPALRAEELQAVSSRIGVSLALSLLLVAILLRLALGSLARTGLALGALAVTLILTAGFAGLAVGALNLISIAFVVLMVGLGIDFAIHYIAHFDEHAVESADRRAALTASAQAIGAAMLLSAATTAVAFFAFATTEFVGMAQLGLIGGMGVLIAFAVALTAIPAAIMVWPGLAAGPSPGPMWQPPTAARRALGWMVIAAAVGLTALAPQARFDADPMNLRDPQAPSVRTYDWLAHAPDFAPLRLSVLAPNAERAEAIAAALKPLPEVRTTRWLGDLIPQDQAAKLDLIDLAYPSLLHAVEGEPTELADPATVATPEALAARLAAHSDPASQALAAELRAYSARRSASSDAALGGALFRYFPLLIDRLRYQLGADEVTADTLPEALRTPYLAPDGTYRVDVAPQADIRDPVALSAFVAAVDAAVPGAAGPPDQIAGAAGAVAGAILKAAALALAGCALLAWMALRDAICITAILLPLLLAAGATAGSGVLLGLPFNYANVIVLPLMIGIGIDSGVHLALRGSREAGSVFDTSTPRAVLYSALTTIAAFGTLALSEHRGTASMGILLAIALVASVAVIFALTPALIRMARRRDG